MIYINEPQHDGQTLNLAISLTSRMACPNGAKNGKEVHLQALRQANYRGVSKHHFPMYLKEIEYRFNHRKENLFRSFVRVYFGYVSP